MKTRLEYNLKVLDYLKKYFEKNPNIRFFQGLWNVCIVEWKEEYQIKDKYSQESSETFDNLKLQ